MFIWFIWIDLVQDNIKLWVDRWNGSIWLSRWHCGHFSKWFQNKNDSLCKWPVVLYQIVCWSNLPICLVLVWKTRRSSMSNVEYHFVEQSTIISETFAVASVSAASPIKASSFLIKTWALTGLRVKSAAYRYAETSIFSMAAHLRLAAMNKCNVWSKQRWSDKSSYRFMTYLTLDPLSWTVAAIQYTKIPHSVTQLSNSMLMFCLVCRLDVSFVCRTAFSSFQSVVKSNARLRTYIEHSVLRILKLPFELHDSFVVLLPNQFDIWCLSFYLIVKLQIFHETLKSCSFNQADRPGILRNKSC